MAEQEYDSDEVLSQALDYIAEQEESAIFVTQNTYRPAVPELPPGKQYHLYVSCNEDEGQYGQQLVRDLRDEYGLSCFFPLEDIQQGTFAPPVISENIEQSLMIVLLISNEYLAVDLHGIEFMRALTYAYQNDENSIIPVLLQDVPLPPAHVLSDRQCIKAFQEDVYVKQSIVNTICGREFAGEIVPNRVERLTRENRKLEEMRLSHGEGPEISSEFRSILAKSKRYFEDNINSTTFVRTQAYNKASDILDQHNILVLTGHPGEGKTTLATQLLLEKTPVERILKLNSPSDWKHVDPSLNLFDAVMIDDIFGTGVLEETLLQKWGRRLPDVYRITQKPQRNKSAAIKRKPTYKPKDVKPIKVVITTRHYILEESKQNIRKFQLFRDEHVQMLLSSELTETEMSDILQVHLKERKRVSSQFQIQLCLKNALGKNVFIDKSHMIFGFPECASLYSNNDDIFSNGPDFFKHPNTFFKTCIEDLLRDEERFFGLLVIWANPFQKVTLADLELSSISAHVKEIANSFGLSCTEAVKKARKSLSHHKGSFLTYNSYDGSYEFMHKVISDMIGIAISKEYPEATLEYAPSDFLMKYVVVRDGDPTDFEFLVGPHLYEKLSATIVRLVGGGEAQRQFTSRLGVNLGEHQSWFKKDSVYKPNLTCDFSIITHQAFKNAEFVDRFLVYIQTKGMTSDLFHRHVLQFEGVFKGYGITFEQIDFHLLSYLVLSDQYTLAKAIIEQKVLENNDVQKSEMTLSLLLAVDKENFDLVKFLLAHGSKVAGDTIYVAAHKTNIRLLDVLVNNPDTDIDDKGHIMGGNTALIMAAKRGKVESVRYLAEKGANVGVRNNKNVSALDKAVLHKQEEICKILIKHGADVNIKGGKFKRTPLHIAADKGHTEIAQILMTNGARVDIKDHRGHFPIHCAAIQGHTEIVLKIINHNKAKANLKATSYGTKSFIKGLTVYHIAIWKGNDILLDRLIKSGIDPNVGNCFGETPLYYAISRGRTLQAQKLIRVADVDKCQKQGYTPLHLSIYKDMVEATNMLVGYADVNIKDRFGKTPLHVACKKGDIALVRRLINAKVDIRMITNRGDTVYHILLRRMHKCKDIFAQDIVQKIAHLFEETDVEFSEMVFTNTKGHSCSVKSFPTHRPSPILENMMFSSLAGLLYQFQLLDD